MNSQPALRRIVTLSALALALAPATAVAQSSDEGYETDGPTVQNKIDAGGTAGQEESGTSPTPAANEDSGRKAEAGLPFTGLDLGLLAGAGVLLVGLGVGMRLVLRLPPAVR
ncbi:MAG TPA: hypothetical protein VEX39_02960 [Thermoleophilaceae bacterium]|nr:hypothetical protein [Thermoleophilaceae bacterium]